VRRRLLSAGRGYLGRRRVDGPRLPSTVYGELFDVIATEVRAGAPHSASIAAALTEQGRAAGRHRPSTATDELGTFDGIGRYNQFAGTGKSAAIVATTRRPNSLVLPAGCRT